MWSSSTSTCRRAPRSRALPSSTRRSRCCGPPAWSGSTRRRSTSGTARRTAGSGRRRPLTGWRMRRGDVYLVDLDPVRGSEASKARPAVIVSNDAANRSVERHGRGVITVVPVTSSTDRVYAFQVLLEAGQAGLAKDSKAQCEQVRAVAVERLVQRLGTVPPPTAAAIDTALRRHLAL